MTTFDVSSLTLADLEGTIAIDSIRHAAKLSGRSLEETLAEVTAEALSIHELTVGLQCRADAIIEDTYAEASVLPFRPRPAVGGRS